MIKVTSRSYRSPPSPFAVRGMIDGKRFSFHPQKGRLVGATILQPHHSYRPAVGVSPFFVNDMCDMHFPQVARSVIEDYHRPACTVRSCFESIMKFRPRKQEIHLPEQLERYYRLALYKLDCLFERKMVDALSREEILSQPLQYLQEPSASAGYPYVLTEQRSKRAAVLSPTFAKRFTTLTHMMKRKPRQDGFAPYRLYTSPCIAYQKSTASTVDREKIRLIWGYPVEMVLAETMFAHPLIELAKELELASPRGSGGFPTCYTFGPYTDAWSSYVSAHFNKFGFVRDFTAYDTTVPEWLIRDVFSVLKKHLRMKDSYGRIFDNVVDYFVHTPIVVPETCSLFVKHHGIPSGSMFTSLVGSLCNYVASLTAVLAQGKWPIDMRCMGDDNLCICEGYDWRRANATLVQAFGFEINDHKCQAGALLGVKFLGRTFSRNEFGWSRDLTASVVSAAYPHSKDDEASYATRLYALYLDNPTPLLYNMVSRHYATISGGTGIVFRDRELARFMRQILMFEPKQAPRLPTLPKPACVKLMFLTYQGVAS